MAKMSNTMVALCATAIGIIYSAGYVVTENPGTAIAKNIPAMSASAQPEQKTVAEADSAQQAQNDSEANAADVTANQGNASTSKAAASQGKYRDGTYYGQGTNRFGTVGVAVTIKQGKIISCKITESSTHYPQSYIDPVLPEQVVARQNGNVDVVSGATRSTEDFQMAVQQALQQAQA
ncbi:FMN-binding protein [Fodinisporobacter ferrooxydans]|uniref:FMN-binding protein n=1 Tax=Fodinisporobacter ferrooxydans TaxID=2901836 RepID=A0ABY4CPZ9_9BACL|nr:FMN-binding protein [Alicyclobacillaceae bacterium MYW30-H2]